MLRVCVGFLLGLSCLFWLQNSQQTIVVLSLSLMTALIAVVWLNKKWMFLTAVSMGLAWGSFSALVWLSTTPQLLASPQVSDIKGYICSLPAKKDSFLVFGQRTEQANTTLRFDFCLTQINDQLVSFYQANKVRLSIYRASETKISQMKAGSYWRISAKLKPLHGRLNPGSFDYEKWLLSEGFVATGYIKSASPYRAEQFSLTAHYQSIRQGVFNRLDRVLSNTDSKGMILALAIGERSSINADQWQAVKGSGTSHLLAISGLHIGIAALWGYYLAWFLFSRMTWLTNKIPAQKLAEITSLMAALSIALLSGFGFPAQRALLMLAVFLTSRWSGRYLTLSHIFAVSIVLIAVLQPFAILSVSFWLSLLAVAIIVFAISYTASVAPASATTKQHIQWLKLKAWLRINWLLFLGLAPITWIVFDSVSVVAFTANLILIPLTSFVTTPLVYLALFSILFNEQLAIGLFYLADKMVAFTFQIQQSFSDMNEIISVSSLPALFFVLLLLAVSALLMPAKFPAKSLLLPIVLIGFFSFTQTKQDQGFKMVVFDIGQGLAIHLSMGGKNLLYDTGYGNAEFSMASSSLLPYFKREGIHHLDQLVISHADADHAGGLRDILQQLSVTEILLGEALKKKSDPLQAASNCHRTPAWSWGGDATKEQTNESKKIIFEFLPHVASQPLYESPLSRGNNASCVLQVSVADKKILLTGDIEKEAERALLRSDLGRYYLLVAPHHGSLTSSTTDFVTATQAQWVIFSTGYANQWGFPKEKVVERYKRIGSKILITDQSGAIIVEQVQNNELQVSTERSKRPHFWQLDLKKY